MPGVFQFGAVLFWEQFPFDGNGVPKDKFLVVVGAKHGFDCLLLLANTNRKHKHLKWGCNGEAGYYSIPGGGKDFFPDDTLIALRPWPVGASELIKHGMDKRVRVVHNLATNVAGAIRNCLKGSSDISADDLELL